jgi:hypothetical protein
VGGTTRRKGVLAWHTRGSRRSEALTGPGSDRRHRPRRVGAGGAGLLRAVREQRRGREREKEYVCSVWSLEINTF